MLQRGMGDRPALAALTHDLSHGHANVGEEHFVELCRAGHGLERADLDARRAHRKDQITDASNLVGCIRLRADQREHHVSPMRGRGPDLLAVDDEVRSVFHGTRLQRRQVRPRAGLGVTLAPDDVAPQRRSDPLLLLLLCPQLQQCRDQHRYPLVHQAPRRLGARELFSNDVRLQHVGRGAEATVLRGNCPGRVPALNQANLPGARFRCRAVDSERFRKLTGVVGKELAHLVPKRFVLWAVAQVHRRAFASSV